MRVETEVREVKSPAQHHTAGASGSTPHTRLLTTGVKQGATGSALLAHPALQGESGEEGSLGGETGMASASGGHLLPIQVKPQEIPRVSVRLLCFPINGGEITRPVNSPLAGCQWAAPPSLPVQSLLPPPPPPS